MTKSIFQGIEPIHYKGPTSKDLLAFHHYNPTEKILGKSMAEHLRFAICYWHSLCWQGNDPFGQATILRPWFVKSDLEHAKLKADAAFELFQIMGVPYFCFHDRDVAPEGDTTKETEKNLLAMAEILAKKMDHTKVKLLWGTANLFSHPRYMAGAATNPDLAVFKYACFQVAKALEITHQLKGENYVLWGGREGYETLLNTDLKQELEQLGRFLSMVVEHKHKIGFKGTLLVEPKPREPSTNQYDFDVATVFGFLKRFGLEKEVKVNIEVGHAFLAGHSFEHEVALAIALGIFGSIDVNRNDIQSGWDTDQFPNNAKDMALPLYYILEAGGFKTGGMNFDAKIRRQSIDPLDLIYGHVGGFDTCALALKMASRWIEEKKLKQAVGARYKSWDTEEGKEVIAGKVSLAELAMQPQGIGPQPKSGQQEYFELFLRE